MQKEVTFSESGDELTARLSGEIDHHLAKKQRIEIDSMLFRKKPKLLVLDFSLVRFMDSSGIGLIIGRAELASNIGCTVLVTGLSKSLYKILKLSGIERIKGIRVALPEGCG